MLIESEMCDCDCAVGGSDARISHALLLEMKHWLDAVVGLLQSFTLFFSLCSSQLMFWPVSNNMLILLKRITSTCKWDFIFIRLENELNVWRCGGVADTNGRNMRLSNNNIYLFLATI